MRPVRFVCLALLLGWAGAALGDERCGLRLVAEVPLRDTDGFLSVEAAVGGAPASMLVDTGSDAGLLSAAAARTGRLPVERRRMAVVSGTGGGSLRIPVATASLGLGGLLVRNVAFPLGALPALPRIAPPVQGLIGGDLLSGFEVEFDVAGGVLRLYQASGLSSLCRDLPPWSGVFDTVALTRAGDRMVVPAVLDGRPIEALLDSGARSRIVARRAALAAGVDAAVLDGEAGGLTSGIDGHEVVYHWHRFRRLQIGEEIAPGPMLTVTPLEGPFEMLLGADWFERHLVWVSYGTGRLFFRPAASGQR